MVPASEFKVLDAKEAASPLFLAEWQRLSEIACVTNPFYDPAFCLPAIDALCGGEMMFGAVYNENRQLVAFSPFVTTRVMNMGPKVTKLWTHDYVPLGSPLIAPGEGDAFADLLSGIMSHTKTPILAVDLKGRSKLGGISQSGLTVDILDHHERAVLITDCDGPGYRSKTLSRQRRQGLDRRFRRLTERTAPLGPLEIELCDDPACLPARFEEFLQLEKSGWKGGNKTALLNNHDHAEFARRAALLLVERRLCRVATLRAGNTALAALVILAINGEMFSWKTAFDETYADCSPGAQLLARFADPLMGRDEMVRLDSCSAANNAIANAIWGERTGVETVLFSPARQAAGTRSIIRMERLKARAKQTAKTLLGR